MKFKSLNLRINIIFYCLLSILTNIKAVSVLNHHPEDEYMIEHQVLLKTAYQEARNLQIYPGPIPGCKACTSAEMGYCRDGRVIDDHCCCDSSYNEVLRFVEHTCRVGQEACKVHAGDCAEYSRLRECCCHSYLGTHWKYLAGGAENKRISYLPLLVIIFISLFGLLR